MSEKRTWKQTSVTTSSGRRIEKPNGMSEKAWKQALQWDAMGDTVGIVGNLVGRVLPTKHSKSNIVPLKPTRLPRIREFDAAHGGGEEKKEPLPSSEESTSDRLEFKADSLDWLMPLTVGSDAEIAQRIGMELGRQHGKTVYCEGEFLRWGGKCWVVIPEHELRQMVLRFDAIHYGEMGGRVKLGSNRVDSVIKILGTRLFEPNWFEERRIGINCLNGFIEFVGGEPRLVEHSPGQRQRHVLPGRWEQQSRLFKGSLLDRLLHGGFEKGDEDIEAKIDLLAEVAGAAALGCATQLVGPRAVVLLGREAENGKSQILHLLRGLVSEDGAASVSPKNFDHEYYSVGLVGKLLNASDELGTANAIASERFKLIITGEPVDGRNPYNRPIKFRAQAQHVFACNQLPTFHGGMDRGVIRRLLVIVFNRTVPREERILHFGAKVLKEEMDLVLDWVVAGAARLLQRGHFLELMSGAAALKEWSQGADPVQAWVAERLEKVLDKRLASRDAYSDFKTWAQIEGYAGLPYVNTFTQRVSATGIKYVHSGGFRGFDGVKLRGHKFLTMEELEKATKSQG
jgi:hypothetical protein